jgi:hypothetical protein
MSLQTHFNWAVFNEFGQVENIVTFWSSWKYCYVFLIFASAPCRGLESKNRYVETETETCSRLHVDMSRKSRQRVIIRTYPNLIWHKRFFKVDTLWLHPSGIALQLSLMLTTEGEPFMLTTHSDTTTEQWILRLGWISYFRYRKNRPK